MIPLESRRAKAPRPIAVMVVDHNPILLAGIAVLIRSQPDLRLVGTARNAATAIALYRRSAPDVTVVDLELPHSAAAAVICAVRSFVPGAMLIGLANSPLDPSGQVALAAGLIAVIAKDQLDQTLISVIRNRVRSTE